MATIAILEGDIDYSQDILDGWFRRATRKIKKASRKVKRVTRRATRPIRRVTRPVTRPLDRVLKRTPLVRSAYRAGITASYAATLQPKKAFRGVIRTGKSLARDFASGKKMIRKFARATVGKITRKGAGTMSKTAMKVIALPSVTAFASAKFPPYTWYAPIATNLAIDEAYKLAKRKSGSVGRSFLSMGRRNLRRFARNISAPKYEAQKMSFIPRVGTKPQIKLPPLYPQTQEQPVEKPAISPALLALPALALLMGA